MVSKWVRRMRNIPGIDAVRGDSFLAHHYIVLGICLGWCFGPRDQSVDILGATVSRELMVGVSEGHEIIT